MTGVITDISLIKRFSDKHGVPLVLWCFWAEGEMNDARKLSLEYMVKHVGLPVVMVSRESIYDLALPGFGIHPAFEYLSAVHQSDYVRTYLWHYYGGAWHDIKATQVDLSVGWEYFEDPSVYFVGKPETQGGAARVIDCEGRWMPDYWKELVSVIAWVGRPRTSFSQAMVTSMHRFLDEHLGVLKRYPGRHPREKKIESKNVFGKGFRQTTHLFSGRSLSYPIPWTLFGNLFHPLNYEFRDHVSKDLPRDSIKNAGIYHR